MRSNGADEVIDAGVVRPVSTRPQVAPAKPERSSVKNAVSSSFERAMWVCLALGKHWRLPSFGLDRNACSSNLFEQNLGEDLRFDNAIART